MAKDNSSSFRSIPRAYHHSEDHENDPDNVRNHIPHPPSSVSSRSPLNCIPDPSQIYRHKESVSISQELDNLYNHHQVMYSKANVTPRFSGKGGGGKTQSEPNSAHSTPFKVVNRVSNIGTKGGSLSKAFRDISVAGGEELVQVPHFELVENHSFWKDHNVQVLIRIRPLTNIEKVSQEYWRCLRQESSQTVTWLGQPETRFTFDHVASETISQEELFKAAGLPIVENCMSGYNSCIFAYGQTGSGKTYTMMGEIDKMYGKLHEDCGITPRIFEYLFKRIREEEYNRRDERLKYSCKCSFLEIYNEQITDLLEPSSTNLQLREDLKKGVYVENLSEYSAENVDDILSLLVQGAANRKMAATKMNSESSRSHCVFTCIIESHWEKDTMTHLRFGRLNLVDLAGSERQKSSGAEGDRLKEAANINKSLSTLGLVIMSLVDLAHGKQRHVPYRDSRLTFLLQDSLGGNSKTTIIANVSPCIGSANETLSTLKFAQRAKLIQNNAKVNEDASGDVTSLQRQIQHLKGQLSFLLNQHKGEESFPRNPLDLDEATSDGFSERSQYSEARNADDICRTSCRCSTMVCSKGTLLGTFRREKLADLETKRLKAEIKQMKHIVDHLQEDAQHNKTMLRSRDEKIKRLELLADESTPVDKFLMDENSALREEIQLLKAKVEKAPQLSQILLENDRLIEQLRFFDDFYAQEEREILLTEITEIRDQFLKLLEAGESCEHSCSFGCETHQDYNFAKELEEQRVKNSELVREVKRFQQKLTEHVQPESEMETSHTVIHLQEEINLLSELQGRLHSVDEENARLRGCLMDKEDEIKALSADWERATLELTSFLSEGSKSLRDASSQIESIACLFPHVNVWIGEHVERAAKMCIEKEKAILLLEGNLEDAQKTILELDDKLSSLRHAMIAFTGVPRIEDDAGNMHRIHLSNIFNGEVNTPACLEGVTTKVGWKPTAENVLKSASLGLKLSDQPFKSLNADETSDAHLGDTDTDLRLAHFVLLEVENAINASFSFVENHFSNLRSDIQETFSLHKESISDIATNIQDVKRNIAILKIHSGFPEMHTAGQQSIHLDKFLTQENEKERLHQMRDEDVLSSTVSHFNRTEHTHSASESSSYMEESSTDFSSSSSETSDDSIVKQNLKNSVFSDQTLDKEYGGCSKQSEESVRQLEILNLDEANRFSLQEDIRAACDTFVKANVLSTADLYSKDNSDRYESTSSVSLKENTNNSIKDGYEESNSYSVRHELESDHCILGELKSLEKINSVDGFFTKFEDARATMMEADYMLNALLNANESAKQYNYLWKQAGIQLKVENEKLVEEIKQLKFTNLSNRESELFQEKIHLSMMQIVNLMLSVKSSLQQNVEDICKRVYSDAITMVEDTRKGISRLRSLLEDISSMMTENGILSFIIHNCQFGDLANELRSLHMQRALSASCIEAASAALDESRKSNPCNKKGYEAKMISHIESGALGHDELIAENMYLKSELHRKEAVLKGILFDLSLLQESLSSRKDTEDESTRLMLTLNQAEQELDMKAEQLDKLSMQHRTLEGRLNETENALYLSNSELEQVRGELEMLSEQNVELRMALKETYLEKSAFEHELEEQRESVENLENELFRMNSLSEGKLVSLRQGVNEDVQRVMQEKEELLEKIQSLQHKLDISQALCDEKEAIALEACQDSEASKVYAEQKEEEVKILEHSIEELECTINVLEKKVYEMESEVEKHRTTGDLLEVELKALRKRLLMVESITDGSIIESSQNQISRKLLKGSLEHHEVHNQIKRLEEEKEILAKEVKQYRDCITELLVHADAQAVQYQQKYKNLEAMVKEVKTESSNIESGASTQDRTEQNLPKTRGSSSPFRCISNLVQQMNIEKDKELSTANQRIEELENLLACRQKQVCLLNTRLAAVESMTHDVIRDLLGVKLDMTNYADFVSQNQLQKLVKDAQQQSQEFIHMEKEVQNLQRQISELMQQRDMLILEVKRREADELTTQTALEQLRERDYMLSAQNEMLKADRSKLQREVVELDEIITTLVGTQDDIK